MAVVVAMVLGRWGDGATGRQADKQAESYAVRLMSHVSRWLPAYLYVLSTLMFTIVNLARGYAIAGLVGVLVLLVVFARQTNILTRRRGEGETRRQRDKRTSKFNV
jgi:4-hydroxybenzoate polyprenyltransferase